MHGCKVFLKLSLFAVYISTISLAIDVYVSPNSYTWDAGMSQMPCNIVDEGTYETMRSEPIHLKDFAGQLLGRNTVTWIGSYASYVPGISFSGSCYYTHKDSIPAPWWTFTDQLLLNCYIKCNNSTFWIMHSSCFCDRDLRKNAIRFSPSNECDPMSCNLKRIDTYQCGYYYQDDYYCACIYYSVTLTRSWRIPPLNVEKSYCTKATVSGGDVRIDSAVCSKSYPVLCGSLLIRNNSTSRSTLTISTLLTHKSSIYQPSIIPSTETDTKTAISRSTTTISTLLTRKSSIYQPSVIPSTKTDTKTAISRSTSTISTSLTRKSSIYQSSITTSTETDTKTAAPTRTTMTIGTNENVINSTVIATEPPYLDSTIDINKIILYSGIGGGIFIVLLVICIYITVSRRTRQQKTKSVPTLQTYSVDRSTEPALDTQNEYSEICLDNDNKEATTSEVKLEAQTTNPRSNDISSTTVHHKTRESPNDSMYNVLHEENEGPDVASDLYDLKKFPKVSMYNVLHEENKVQEVASDVYDHVPDVRNSDYDLLERANTACNPVSLTDYDCMKNIRDSNTH